LFRSIPIIAGISCPTCQVCCAGFEVLISGGRYDPDQRSLCRESEINLRDTVGFSAFLFDSSEIQADIPDSEARLDAIGHSENGIGGVVRKLPLRYRQAGAALNSTTS
jgi:hypothetical protein